MKVKAIVLAAGDSSRMGTPKALLKYGDKTFLELAAQGLRGAEIEDIYVCVGKHSKEIINSAKNLNLKFVINPRPEDGMISSLRCALKEAREGADAIMLSLVDQPLIKSEIYKNLLKTCKQHQGSIIIAKYNNKKRGHPIILPSNVFNLCYEGPLDLGLHWVTHHKDVTVTDMNTQDIAVITDVDTLEDYKKLGDTAYGQNS